MIPLVKNLRSGLCKSHLGMIVMATWVNFRRWEGAYIMSNLASKHLLIRNSNLAGMEYGMLRDFEDEISRVTGAQISTIPSNKYTNLANKRFGHGTRYKSARNVIPKTDLSIPSDVDVVWVILMGPENFCLDLFKNWYVPGKKYILYFFDTLEHQYELTTSISNKWNWDLLISSFPDAIEPLQKATQKKWHFIAQGVKGGRFESVPFSERNIGFSSYGRRDARIHSSIEKFCSSNNIYYDYTAWSGIGNGIDPRSFYRQYSWHVCHSMFNVCYPVEQTHPNRAGSLKPITCRWFEVLAAGTPIIGAIPGHASYKEVVGTDFHIKLPLRESSGETIDRLENAWSNRQMYLSEAHELSRQLSAQNSWQQRIESILERL
jgi:hypothetical protein